MTISNPIVWEKYEKDFQFVICWMRPQIAKYVDIL